ncbi:MAG TPA: hypothetical protein VHA06_07755 [Candidatus Angelobacter sp.]|jgi:hypothetical protein|nr:hypothetical protein [Candidatus Angelobacter sp.]
MTLQKIFYSPKAMLEFTKADIVTLRDCAEAHYDHTCRQTAQVGGFIYGLVNSSEVFVDSVERLFTFREVDLMGKITEIPPAHLRNAAAALHFQFHNILHQLNEAFKEKNP